MRKIVKNIGRSILSCILCLTILMSGLCFFDIGSVISAALISKSSNALTAAGSTTAYPSVYFIVPEAVYLKPSISSRSANESAQFQWFVGQTASFNSSTKTVSTSKQTGEQSSGNLYFYYANASSVSISFRWVNSKLENYSSSSAGSGAYINVGGSQLNCMNYSSTAAKSFTYSTNMVTAALTTSSNSPTLSTSETGCYIEWHATFTDSVDGYSKTVTAYTYVYKPYNQPIGVAINTRNNRGTNHWGHDLSWISGFHGIVSADSYYPLSSKFAPFASSASGTAAGEQGGLNLQLASYFTYSGVNNTSSASWLSSSSGGNFNEKSMHFIENTINGHNRGDDMFQTFGIAPTAKLYVDTSRYTNLNQIPNISAGLLVTSDESSNDDPGGAWYVGYTESPYKTSDYMDYWHERQYGIDMWNTYKGLFASVGGADTRVKKANLEGLKYNGRINISISGSGTKYVQSA